MRVSARSDYAVRALIEVAARPGEPVTAEVVSRAQDIPLKFLLGILGELFKDRPVVGIHAVDLVLGFGSLHCLTQQQPA